MAAENFTSGWTESDSGTILSQTSTVSSFTAMPAGAFQNQLLADKGAGAYSGNFKFRFASRITAASSNNSRVELLSVHGVAPSDSETGDPWFTVRWENTTTNPTLYLAIFDSGNTTVDTPTAQQSYQGAALAVNTYFYCEVERNGTTLTCKIYSDAGFSTLVNTLTLSGITVATYRYVTAPKVWWIGSGATITGTVENLDLAVTGGVSGTLGGTESASDTLAISGNVGNNGIRLTLRDTDTGALAANLSELILSIRAASNSASLLASATKTTNASGVLEHTLGAALSIGTYVYVTLEKADNSIVATYRLQVIDLNA